MNQENANSNSINVSSLPQAAHDSRCQHHFVNGTRCLLFQIRNPSSAATMPASPSMRTHLPISPPPLPPTSPNSNPPFPSTTSSLTSSSSKPKTASTPAADMAYTCNLLLRTLPAVEEELHPEDEVFKVDFGDLPRPPR